MKKKFSTKGIIPGLSFDLDHSDFDYNKHLKKLIKESKVNTPKNTNSMEDIQKLIYDIADKTTKDSPITPKDALDIPEKQLEGLYALAHNLYESGKYDEAANMFRLLVMVNHFEFKYLFGLAASLQLLKEYFQAATTYMIAATLDTSSPLPHYHAAECYLKLHDPGSACISLGLAIDSASNQEKYALLKERCQLTKERLTKFIKKKIHKKKLEKLKKKKKIKKKVEGGKTSHD